MMIEDALRLTEVLLGLAFIQQSTEHLVGSRNEKIIFIPRLILSILLVIGFQTPFACLGLIVTAFYALHRFHGPYNGGSDRMGLLILSALTLAHILPTQWREYAFGYLALQVMLSYFMAGWVKIMNPDWRTGRALQDVFSFSVYPVSQSLRNLANKPRLLCAASWGVMLFEIAFPLALISHPVLITGLTIAALFHLANACLFGFNRFVWFWIAAYPSLFWLQDRVFG